MSSLSTTTTAIVGIPTTKLSWPAVPCRWEQSEQSVGTPNGSLDLLGRIKCWTVKDKSPAALAWKAISKSIINLLEDQYEHLDAKDSELLVEIYMIGKKPAKSSSTILFSCESKVCRQKAMELVKKKGILACHPGIRMAECSRLPRLLATGEESELPLLPPGVYLDGPLTSGGIAVLISRGSDTPLRKATVGGIVCIGDFCYGMTTAHAFVDTKELNKRVSNSIGDIEFAFYGGHDSEQSSEDENEDFSTMTSQGSISSNSTNSLKDDASEENTIGKSTSKPIDVVSGLATMSDQVKRRTSPMRIGSLFHNSWLLGDLDFALVKVENLNILRPAHPVTKPRHTINEIQWTGKSIYPMSPEEVADSRVTICTGGNGGAVEGRLSRIPSFMKRPGSNTFQELWTVRLLNGNFTDGDCGSWVVQLRTGVFYGHIVSGYPESGTAYILPAWKIFRKCEQLFKQLLRFSTAASEASQVMEGKESQATSKEQTLVSRSRPRVAHIFESDEAPSPGPTETFSTAPNYQRPLTRSKQKADYESTPPPRPSSAYGVRDKILDNSIGANDDGYTPTSKRLVARSRTSMRGQSTRSKQEVDYESMPPPPRPTAYFRRPATEYSADFPDRPDPSSYHSSRTNYVERKRPSYYRPSTETTESSGYDTKVREAQIYQQGVDNPISPLTADALKQQQRRLAGSSRSTQSSESRDESDYLKSTTTQTTWSANGSGDENVTIKVTGQARVIIGGAQIECTDGGEIEIKRQRDLEDRRSRDDRQQGRSRMSSSTKELYTRAFESKRNGSEQHSSA